MAHTYYRELLAILERNGCFLIRVGRHPMFYSPISKTNFPVPTGIKSRHTANEVFAEAVLIAALKKFLIYLSSVPKSF
jgi:hypothetical protein